MTTVVWAHSGETNAPVLNNAAGSLDALLHAMLVTGWNLQTAASVVVTGNVAAVTLAGHGFANNRVVEVAGATPADLNGRKRITVTNANTFTFPAPGVPDGTATGTISVKRASVGWTRPHSSGNVSIYARSDPTATAMMLRINDSGSNGASATHARGLMVWGGVTDVNTFTERAPLDSVVSGGTWWNKGANTAAAKPWVFVGNEKCFYLFADHASWPATSYFNMPAAPMFFGDINSFRPSDAFACAIAASHTVSGSTFSTTNVSTATSSHAGDMSLARASYGVGAPVAGGVVGPLNSNRMGGSGPLYPSPVDGGLVIQHPVLVAEAVVVFGNPLRGTMPGMGMPLASIPAGLLHLQEFSNLNGLGRDWLLVGHQRDSAHGHAAFDITGPW